MTRVAVSLHGRKISYAYARLKPWATDIHYLNDHAELVDWRDRLEEHSTAPMLVDIRTKGSSLSTALPGKASMPRGIGLAKAALRVAGGSELADAIGDLTGLGRMRVKTLADRATQSLADRPSDEFRHVSDADRDWAEGVVSRSYQKLASDRQGQILTASVVGPEAVATVAYKCVSTAERADVESASPDARAYLTSLSQGIAALICNWYESDPESNQLATTRALGETLDSVRKLPEQIDHAFRQYVETSLLPQLIAAVEDHQRPQPNRRQTVGDTSVLSESPELIEFLLHSDFTPVATDAEFIRLVERATVAVIEDRPVTIVASLPSFAAYPEALTDPVIRANYIRRLRRKCEVLALNLEALFSKQVDSHWGGYLGGLAERVTIARAIFAGPTTAGTKLDIWRTTSPQLSAPVWLSREELDAVLHHLGFASMNYLAFGAGWRAADELPRSLVVAKVMPAILAAIVRGSVTSLGTWSGEILDLPTWHIGEG